MNKNRSLTVLTSLVLTACFVMTASLFLALKNFNHFLMSWGKDLQMTVYLKEDSQENDLETLVSKIQKTSAVQEVRKISSEENFQQFKAQMGSLFPQLDDDKEIKSLVPQTLQVIFDLKTTLKDPVDLFKGLAEQIRENPAVEQVSYGQLWVEKFSRFFAFIRHAFWFMALAGIAANVFVFSNAVRAWVNSKRFEIEVLELVGATAWSIRKPFVMKGLLLGLITGSLGLSIVFGILEYFRSFMAKNEMMASLSEKLQTFSITEGLLFISFATGLGVMAAYLCVKEINHGWAAAERN